MNKTKNIILSIVFAVFLFSASAACFLKPDTEFSNSERRPLASFPTLNLATVANGEFMDSFEEYTADQFPMRDNLRALKALFAQKVLGKLDNNGVFMAEGHLSKIDDKENPYMMDYSSKLFKSIIERYVKGKNADIYFSIVPDKNYFLAKKNGYPSLEYDLFIEKMKEKTEFMKYLDVTKLLSLDSYYKTDTHWKQEEITHIAQYLAREMGTVINNDYTLNTLKNPFYGVYAGQYAIPVKPDTIKYLTNDIIDNCIVTYYDNGLPVVGDMYNMKKAEGKDPYEMFLSGSAPLLTIENPSSKNNKELIIFRDSFGSSLAPLLAEGYKKITVVDVRYIQSGFISNFVDFENCDVLFIYSTALLNNSLAMK